jgi:hypothetical protein
MTITEFPGTTEGRIVLIVTNDSWNVRSFRIQYLEHFGPVRLPPGAVAI